MSQIERRFIVKRLRENFPNWSEDPYEIITQGYWDTREHDLLRVRKIERPGRGGSTGEMVHKLGHGIMRGSDRIEVSLQMADWTLRTCPYQVEKLRWTFGPWRLDIFQGHLKGLVMAEVTVADSEESVHFPDWLLEATEVTNQLNNLHIAKMTSALSGRSCPEDYIDYLSKVVPRIILTGGPGSGKTTIMEIAQHKLGARLHLVPEVATIIISQVGVKPPQDEVGLNLFQQHLYEIQHEFEELSRLEAIASRKQAVLHDRGKLDAGAYIEGGTLGLQRLCRTDYSVEIARAPIVIQLDVPPRGIYDKIRGNNAARFESHEEAMDLDDAITSAYSKHPGFHLVSGCQTMERKIEKTLNIIENFLDTLEK